MCALLTGVAAAAHGQTVRADALGSDNFTTPLFWGVQFQSGMGFIQSVTFDLTADADAYFDFDGGASFDNATGPVLGGFVGLGAADITASYGSVVDGNPAHPAVLTFNFAAGSFGLGDLFRFGADTDFFVSDPTPGGAIGSGGAQFTVVFQDGTSASGAFQTLSSLESAVVVSSSVVPEPSTWMLLGTGLLSLSGVAVVRRRSRA